MSKYVRATETFACAMPGGIGGQRIIEAAIESWETGQVISL